MAKSTDWRELEGEPSDLPEPYHASYSTFPIKWARVIAWCRAHPGQARVFRRIYHTAPRYLKAVGPHKEDFAKDMRVISGNYDPPDNTPGRRVCDMWVWSIDPENPDAPWTNERSL